MFWAGFICGVIAGIVSIIVVACAVVGGKHN